MRTIFIVDDSRTNLVTAQQALSGVYRTLQMESAAQLFELLERVVPDMILMDIDMPGMNGFEATAKLRADSRFRGVPVIFLTASDNECNEVRGFELGAVDFVSKPFSKPILLKRIQTHIGIDAIVKQRTAEVERLKNGIIAVFADMVEGRDKETGNHIGRTQKYLEILIGRLVRAGVYADRIAKWDLSVALPSAQLHDIGKVTISDLVLNKPGKLTDEEFEIMKTHAAEGERLIDKIAAQVGVEDAAFLNHARLFAGAHHEKWNGAGYPRGLTGENIPLEGRIMAVVDVYDALTSARVYKAKMPHEQAVHIIRESAGSHFDPAVAAVFLNAEQDFDAARSEFDA